MVQVALAVDLLDALPDAVAVVGEAADSLVEARLLLVVGSVLVLDVADGLPRLATSESEAAAGEAQLVLGLDDSARRGPTPEEREVLDALREVEPSRTTPIDALVLLERLVEKLGRPGGDESPR